MEERELNSVSMQLIKEYMEDKKSLACIAYGKIIKDVFYDLIEFFGRSIEICNVHFDDFCPSERGEEYILQLDGDEISVKKLCDSKGQYREYFSHVVYIQDDCDREVLCACVNDEATYGIFTVEKIEEDEDDECCCEDCTCDEESEPMHGFSMTKTDEFGTITYSFYSGDIEMVKEMRSDWKRFLGE